MVSIDFLEKFLRFYIQFLEKNIRKLDFSPEGACTIVQVTDLKNSPGLFMFKKELRQAVNQALQLLQDIIQSSLPNRCSSMCHGGTLLTIG
ncbi:patellin-3-like [Salvia miltiorrhiza]|uniref:patellin-3-like n=1 Tax=Salvia miltiorrhiza TaxID=226208 RepID=UPI0025AC27BD|nr:patellin-3-like [Salvia miltiorrhiza]